MKRWIIYPKLQESKDGNFVLFEDVQKKEVKNILFNILFLTIFFLGFIVIHVIVYFNFWMID